MSLNKLNRINLDFQNSGTGKPDGEFGTNSVKTQDACCFLNMCIHSFIASVAIDVRMSFRPSSL